MIEVVPFTAERSEEVRAVILSIQQAEFGLPISIEGQPDLLDISGFYQRGAGNFWVALKSQVVVGTVAVLDIGDGYVALRKMFVKAEYRGPRYGVAKGLLEVLFQWCSDRAIKHVYLGTTAAFLAAHRFYEKNGFLEVNRTELPPRFPIMAVDTKFYCRTLQTNEPTAQTKGAV